MNRAVSLYLWLSAAVFLGFGLALLAWPPLLEAVDMAPTTPTAAADARADYGGCAAGIGVFLLACALRPGWARAGTCCAALTLAGFGLGRVIGIAVDGSPRPIIYWLLLFEVPAAAAGFYLLWRSRP